MKRGLEGRGVCRDEVGSAGVMAYGGMEGTGGERAGARACVEGRLLREGGLSVPLLGASNFIR